jgi:hypothetical protein
MATEDDKDTRTRVGVGPEDAEHIDLDEIPPERVPFFLMMFLAQNMEKAGLSDDFVLLVRRRADDRPGLFTTVRDPAQLRRMLRSAANKADTLKEGEADEEAVNMSEFMPRRN